MSPDEISEFRQAALWVSVSCVAHKSIHRGGRYFTAGYRYITSNMKPVGTVLNTAAVKLKFNRTLKHIGCIIMRTKDISLKLT